MTDERRRKPDHPESDPVDNPLREELHTLQGEVHSLQLEQLTVGEALMALAWHRFMAGHRAARPSRCPTVAEAGLVAKLRALSSLSGGGPNPACNGSKDLHVAGGGREGPD